MAPLSLHLAVLLLLTAPGCMTAKPHPKDTVSVYVSPAGNDSWSGALPDPSRDRTDGPFATLERARDAVRSLMLAGKLRGGATVYLRGGLYERRNTLLFTALDSGTTESPVIWRPFPGEQVRLTGGKRIGNFKPVTDPMVLRRLDILHRSEIVRADLRLQGIRNYGALNPRGFGRSSYPAALELFFNGRPMPLSGFPNNGWVRIAGVPEARTDSTGSGSGPSQPTATGPRPVLCTSLGTVFRYEGDRPRRWADTGDIWLHGWWALDRGDSYERVQSIYTATRTIETRPSHSAAVYRENQRYRYLNILEEIDAPGEWYLDRRTGVLYFWPPSPPAGAEVCVSLLEEPLVLFDHASHITFRGFTLEIARGNAVEINGGTGVCIAGCTIRNIGNTGIIIRGGAGNGVRSCDIRDTGDGGVIMSGGDRKNLVPGGNYAVNNHIFDYSRWVWTYRPAISVSGVGNRAAHNLIHDAPHMAVEVSGNEHIIEYNIIHETCRETGDAGALFISRDWTMRGNVIRYNVFRTIRGPAADGASAVCLDDAASGAAVYGNIFFKSACGVFIGGGRDNTVENNIFAGCDLAVHVDARGMGWAKENIAPGGSWGMYGKLDAVGYRKQPYRTRYPKLASIADDTPALPKGNKIRRNISTGVRWLELADGLDSLGIVRVEDNVTGGDPGFLDTGGMDFRLARNSPARKIGFAPIPSEKIGLYRDSDRVSLPK